MLMETKNFIPQVYGKERNIQVFTKLLDIILSSVKYDIDNFGDIYNPMKCPEEFLPYLAKTLNYDYNFNDTVTANRRIINCFTSLEKNRGSKKGLLVATAMSLESDQVSRDNAELLSDEDYMEALKSLELYIDYENGTIYIDYPNIYNLVRYILDYVRPLGMRLVLRAVTYTNINADTMLLYADMENLTREYNPNVDSFVNRAVVNFSSIGDPDIKKTLQGFSDNDQLNLNN